MSDPLPVRQNFTIDQGQPWRVQRTWIPGGVPMIFAGCTAKLDLRVEPENPTPAISVTTLGGPSGYVYLDNFGHYGWSVAAAALAALTPIQRALYYVFRLTYADGITTDDLIEGVLFQRRNLGIP